MLVRTCYGTKWGCKPGVKALRSCAEIKPVARKNCIMSPMYTALGNFYYAPVLFLIALHYYCK